MYSFFEKLFDHVVSRFLFRYCFICLERLYHTTRLVNSRNTSITSLSRWKRKWFLLPDSTAEPRGLNVHAHEEQGSLKDSNYTEDFPYTLLDRQLMCFRVFQDVEFLMAELREHQEWSRIILIGMCVVFSFQNSTEKCQRGSPCKEPCKKKTLLKTANFHRS